MWHQHPSDGRVAWGNGGSSSCSLVELEIAAVVVVVVLDDGSVIFAAVAIDVDS